MPEPFPVNPPTRMRMTISGEYDADPKHYGEPDEVVTPERMAAIDKQQFEDDLTAAMMMFDDDSIKVTIEPIR